MKILKNMLIIAAMLLPAGIILSYPGNSKNAASTAPEGVVALNRADFLEKVYNYEKNPEKWVYEGELPCIIDFYADWCGPCKRVEPILGELAAEYKGKVIVYRIDVDRERELAGIFGVRSIPMFLFIPKKDNPQTLMGAMPRDSFVKVIEEFLLKDAG
ncbi:MAG: thiol reductase thioredoxin [Tannerella sp.]|jgi:thioredoxin|nr:thiol reductase thioredoxin [Tannerella sp.]